MRKYDIVQASMSWKGCIDLRPWLLLDDVDASVDKVGALPISTKCYSGSFCFDIDSARDEFATTGLAKSCFVHYESIIEVKVADIRVRKGALVGELLVEFQRRSGL